MFHFIVASIHPLISLAIFYFYFPWQPPEAHGFTQLLRIDAFRNERGTVACLGMTLLLPCVKCFLLIKMSPWTQNQKKEDSFCPLSTKQAGSLLSQRDIWSTCSVSWVGSAFCGRGAVTQLWQPSGTSDEWHARMGHAAFRGGSVDSLSSRISHSASVGLIVGRTGRRCDTWISLL